jgi:hypothetical protein
MSRKTKKRMELLANYFPDVGKDPCKVYVIHGGKTG